MGQNQTSFMTGIQTQIADLCQGAQPPYDPAKAAQAWFQVDAGGQPSDVNEWMAAQIAGPAVTKENTTWTDVGGNGTWYYNTLDTTIGSFAKQALDPNWPAGTLKAWEWFNGAEADAPQEVIDWVTPNLPTKAASAASVVIARRPGVTPPAP